MNDINNNKASKLLFAHLILKSRGFEDTQIYVLILCTLPCQIVAPRILLGVLPAPCSMVLGRVTSLFLGRLAIWKPPCWKPHFM